MAPFIASRWTVQNRSPRRARLTHRAQAAVCSCDRAKLTQRAMQSNDAVSAEDRRPRR